MIRFDEMMKLSNKNDWNLHSLVILNFMWNSAIISKFKFNLSKVLIPNLNNFIKAKIMTRKMSDQFLSIFQIRNRCQVNVFISNL
jgi:hypothetical protein